MACVKEHHTTAYSTSSSSDVSRAVPLVKRVDGVNTDVEMEEDDDERVMFALGE